jgi:hypothetical protein
MPEWIQESGFTEIWFSRKPPTGKRSVAGNYGSASLSESRKRRSFGLLGPTLLGTRAIPEQWREVSGDIPRIMHPDPMRLRSFARRKLKLRD